MILQKPNFALASAPQEPVKIEIQTTSAASGGGDDRYTMAPRPERTWATPPDPRLGNPSTLPAIATRGIPESQQTMGVLKMEDGKMMPLQGRRTASRSDRFQQYTRTDTQNPVTLPIQYQKRDCQDDVGCAELFNGDEIVIGPTGEKAQATLYRFDGPTYIPGIVQ